MSLMDYLFMFLHYRSEYGCTSLLSCSTLYPLGLTLSGKFLFYFKHFPCGTFWQHLFLIAADTFNCTGCCSIISTRRVKVMFRVTLGSSLHLISVSVRWILIRTFWMWHPSPILTCWVRSSLYSSLPHCDTFIKLCIKFAVRCCK